MIPHSHDTSVASEMEGVVQRALGLPLKALRDSTKGSKVGASGDISDDEVVQLLREVHASEAIHAERRLESMKVMEIRRDRERRPGNKTDL